MILSKSTRPYAPAGLEGEGYAKAARTVLASGPMKPITYDPDHDSFVLCVTSMEGSAPVVYSVRLTAEELVSALRQAELIQTVNHKVTA
jgi:hypothetical protein